jgi:hypothetical protein
VHLGPAVGKINSKTHGEKKSNKNHKTSLTGMRVHLDTLLVAKTGLHPSPTKHFFVTSRLNMFKVW